MRSLFVLLLLATMIAQTAWGPLRAQDDEPRLVIVTTFSYLKPDIEFLLCNGVVYTLVPPNVDPHDYQLKPIDIELLKRADVIVSTGHTHFELEIRDLVEHGELDAKLVDMLSISGIKISTNPVTEKPNYHLPIRDPVNYVIFMGVLARVLAEIDPDNENCYYGKFHDLMEKLAEGILVYRGLFGGNVVVDSPHIQYCAEWLGFKVTWIIEPEEGIQVTPESIRRVEELVKSKNVTAVFVTKPKVLPGSRFLAELAKEYGVPVVEVHSPASDAGVYNTLLDLVVQIKELKLVTTATLKPAIEDGERSLVHLRYIVTPMIFFIVGFVVGALVSKVRKG